MRAARVGGRADFSTAISAASSRLWAVLVPMEISSKVRRRDLRGWDAVLETRSIGCSLPVRVTHLIYSINEISSSS